MRSVEGKIYHQLHFSLFDLQWLTQGSSDTAFPPWPGSGHSPKRFMTNSLTQPFRIGDSQTELNPIWIQTKSLLSMALWLCWVEPVDDVLPSSRMCGMNVCTDKLMFLTFLTLSFGSRGKLPRRETVRFPRVPSILKRDTVKVKALICLMIWTTRWALPERRYCICWTTFQLYIWGHSKYYWVSPFISYSLDLLNKLTRMK